MQLSSIPQTVITANRDVLGSLQRAQADTTLAQQQIEGSSITAETRQLVDSALAAATQARDGVASLGPANLLDGTFQRYSNHAVRQLTEAARMLDRSGPLSADTTSILTKTIFDAEVSTRLGSQAGERSLAKPSHKSLERATEFSGGGDSSPSGPVWVDGQWLDGLGNPVRGGGNAYVGPDGDSYGWDGTPDRGGDGGYVGPDGESYSGI